MGLSLEGVENLSAAMNRDYDDPNHPRSKDHSRKNSNARNHRTSRESGHNGSRESGPNGSRIVPFEKPLTVIINRTDSYENGHYSNSKSGFNHLLGEEFTKNALSAVHGSSTPISSMINSGPSTSSSTNNAPFASPPRLQGRTEEVLKRKDIVKKVERMRDEQKLESFISQTDSCTPTQIGASVRRYAKKSSDLPINMKNYVLEGIEPPEISKKKDGGQERKNVKPEVDGDATDYEDLETDEARSSLSEGAKIWLSDRAKYKLLDSKIDNRMDEVEEELDTLIKELEEMESVDERAKAELMEGREEHGCARLIPYDNTKRRKILRLERKLQEVLPSTSMDVAALYPPTTTQFGRQFNHRASFLAGFHIRKNKHKSIWLNKRELDEEKMRNGVRKKEERDRREKRKLERSVKEEEEEDKSDEYEETDDDEESTPTPHSSKKTNGAPKEKKRRRDADRKISRNNKGGTRRSSDCAPMSRLSSVASRPSIDGDTMDYLTPCFNHATWLESFKAAMPTNFTYNKIPVPDCKRVEIEKVDVDKEEEAAEFDTDTMMRRMAVQHHSLEHDERIRFQINPRSRRREPPREQREESEESARSRSTPSGRGPSEEGEGENSSSVPPPIPTPNTRTRTSTTRPPVPHFDYNAIRPIADYERLSSEPPYEKRTFSQ